MFFSLFFCFNVFLLLHTSTYSLCLHFGDTQLSLLCLLSLAYQLAPQPTLLSSSSSYFIACITLTLILLFSFVRNTSSFRAPNPDYSMTVEERRVENCKRAELVFQDLKDSGVPLDVYILTTFMTGKMLSLSYHPNI